MRCSLKLILILTFTLAIALGFLTTVKAQTQFIISAFPSGNGTITPSGFVYVNQGSTQSFSIVPSSGYYISQVLVDSINVGPVSSYTFLNVQTSHTIYAYFVQTGLSWHSAEQWSLNVQSVGAWNTAETWSLQVSTSTPTWHTAETWSLNLYGQAYDVVTFSVSGVGNEYKGAVVMIDGSAYPLTSLPATLYWIDGTSHSFAWQASFSSINTTYQFSSCSGLWPYQTGTFVISGSGSITATYTNSSITPHWHTAEQWLLWVYGISPSNFIIQPGVYWELPAYNNTLVGFYKTFYCDSIAWDNQTSNPNSTSAISFTNAYMLTGPTGTPVQNLTVSIWDNITNYQTLFGISQVPLINFTSLSNESLSFYFLAPINTQVYISLSDFPYVPNSVQIQGVFDDMGDKWNYNGANGTVTFNMTFWNIVGAPQGVVIDWTTVWHTAEQWSLNVNATTSFRNAESWLIGLQTSGTPPNQNTTTAPAVPFIFIFGIVGLVCFIAGPSYGVYKYKHHDFRGGAILMIILVAVGFALSISWLWSFPGSQTQAVTPGNNPNPSWHTVEVWHLSIVPSNYGPLSQGDVFIENYKGWFVYQAASSLKYYAVNPSSSFAGLSPTTIQDTLQKVEAVVDFDVATWGTS